MDEAFSHLFATLPMHIAWRAMIVDAVHPPLYYLLLRAWLTCAGGSEFALRLPSAIAGVLTVALLVRAGRKWLGGRAARWAALLLALNPFHVWHSREARMYALLGLLALATLMAFARALRSRAAAAWAALVASSAAAFLSHYFALYLPLIEFAFLLVTFRRHRRALARWAVAQALAVLPLAAWLMALYGAGGGTFGIGWISRPQPADLLKTLWSFSMAYDGRVTWGVVAGSVIWVALAALGLCGVRDRRQAGLLLGLTMMLPPVATFLLSFRRPTYVDRFFIGGLPAFVLLAAAGLALLPRLAGRTAALFLAGLGLWGAVRLGADPFFAKEGWRDAAVWIETREEQGDVLALRHFQYLVPFSYYYRGSLEPVAVTLNQKTTPLEEIAAGHGRVWVVFRGPHDDLHHLAWSEPFDLERDEAEPTVRDWIADHPPEAVETFSGLAVMLFDLRGDP